jgi:hypothetical protein
MGQLAYLAVLSVGFLFIGIAIHQLHREQFAEAL